MPTARMKDATREAAKYAKAANARIIENIQVTRDLRTEVKQLKEMLERRMPTKKKK